VTDRARRDVDVREAIERFGRVDVLVNKAGVGSFAAIEPSAQADHHRYYQCYH